MWDSPSERGAVTPADADLADRALHTLSDGGLAAEVRHRLPEPTRRPAQDSSRRLARCAKWSDRHPPGAEIVPLTVFGARRVSAIATSPLAFRVALRGRGGPE